MEKELSICYKVVVFEAFACIVAYAVFVFFCTRLQYDVFVALRLQQRNRSTRKSAIRRCQRRSRFFARCYDFSSDLWYWLQALVCSMVNHCTEVAAVSDWDDCSCISIDICMLHWGTLNTELLTSDYLTSSLYRGTLGQGLLPPVDDKWPVMSLFVLYGQWYVLMYKQFLQIVVAFALWICDFCTFSYLGPICFC